MIVTDGTGQTPCSFEHYLVVKNSTKTIVPTYTEIFDNMTGYIKST